MSKNRVREFNILVAEDGSFGVTVKKRIEEIKEKEPFSTFHTRKTLNDLQMLITNELIKGSK